jgi:hypothetical protein
MLSKKLTPYKSSALTSNGLPHLTRLLERESWSKVNIYLKSNPGLFDNAENTSLFRSAVSHTTKLHYLQLSFCQLPGHAMISLFQAVSNSRSLRHLSVYDNVRLQGHDLERLLEIIPTMHYLFDLHVNLDFENESVLSSFHWNTSLWCLYSGSNMEEMMHGHVLFGTLDRNRRLRDANELLQQEPRCMIPWGGIWAHGIEQLTHDNNTGATAVYKIMREKLVMWWAPPTPHHPAIAAAAMTTTAGNSATSHTTSSGNIITRSLLEEEPMTDKIRGARETAAPSEEGQDRKKRSRLL